MERIYIFLKTLSQELLFEVPQNKKNDNKKLQLVANLAQPCVLLVELPPPPPLIFDFFWKIYNKIDFLYFYIYASNSLTGRLTNLI